MPIERLGDLLRSTSLNPTERQLKDIIEAIGNPESLSLDSFKEAYGIMKGADEEQSLAELAGQVKFALRTFDHDGTGLIGAEELKGSSRH